MKLRYLYLYLLLLCTPFIFAQDTDFATNTPQPAPDLPETTHVIVITIDGGRPDAILQAHTPVMQGLAENGAVDWLAQTVYQPVTVPAHTSLLTGLDPDQHEVTHNDYSEERIANPTFISLAEDAGYKTAIVAGKEKFIQFQKENDTFYEFVRTGDPGVTDKTIELLNDGYEVLFVHLPNTDFFGHSTGWMSDIYIYELRNTDKQIGRIVDALTELGVLDTTLLIITADHGGHDFEHGQNIREDMTIPMIVYGAGIAPHTVLEYTTITQVASTVLLALGLDPATGMDDSLWEKLPKIQ